MSDYKSVLVKNNTADCDNILYIYSRFDPICWISSSSKILKPGQPYLYRSEDGFKFEIKSIYQQSKKTVVDVRKWKKDLHFTVFNISDVRESDLEDHAFEKTICMRKINVEKETSIDGGRNLYEILKLNFDEIQKLSKKEQDEKIKHAFHREIRRWHSDTAGELGDHDMAHEVIVAYDVLRDREKRAEYHNKANYSKGWLSTARWKSIFFTECETKEQKFKYRKRLAMMALSLGIGIGGLVLSVLTAGAAAPAVVGICGTLGAGCLGGGLQSFLRTINQKSIEKGCDLKDYAKSFGIGFVGGAITGGAGVGITAGIAGIGSAATQASAATVGQLIGIGAGSASVGGVAFSLAADAEKKFVDGVDVTLKQVVGHAVVGAVIGAATGTAVGAVSGAVAGLSAEVSATNIEGKLVPGLRRYGVSLARNLAKGVTNKSTESVLGSVTGFIEERLDDDQDNRPISEHIKESGPNLVASVFTDVATGVVSTTAEHVSNENKVNKNLSKNKTINGSFVDYGTDVDTTITTNQSVNLDIVESSSFDSLDSNSVSQTLERRRIRYDLDQKSILTIGETNVKAKYSPPSDNCVRYNTYLDSDDHSSADENRVNGSSDEEIVDWIDISCEIPITSARFKYISNGHWKSKMIVEYKVNGDFKTEETFGSGSAIEIPIVAENVQVHFKVMRFIATWCDVKRWDRYNQQWYDKPHIFTYECPPEQRTFTLDGSLYYERVTQITNEMHDDVNDM
ncbi:uncharacterized protein [Mytilus edulis]|uniref:uncharacterized protein n=1 Tax=Mytilus edulis TaxID=6550 RepID=UPI0039F0CE6A